MSDESDIQIDPSEIGNLSLTDAVALEDAIESQYDTCPECEEEYIEIGVYNDGAVQFTHGKDGMFSSGCSIEDSERVKEVLP
jgi:hypothetical protein